MKRKLTGKTIMLVMSSISAFALLAQIAFASTPRYRDLRICNLGEVLVESAQHGTLVTLSIEPADSIKFYTEELQSVTGATQDPDGMCFTQRYYSRAFDLADLENVPVDTIILNSTSVMSTQFIPEAYQLLINARIIPYPNGKPPVVR